MVYFISGKVWLFPLNFSKVSILILFFHHCESYRIHYPDSRHLLAETVRQEGSICEMLWEHPLAHLASMHPPNMPLILKEFLVWSYHWRWGIWIFIDVSQQSLASFFCRKTWKTQTTLTCSWSWVMRVSFPSDPQSVQRSHLIPIIKCKVIKEDPDRIR